MSVRCEVVKTEVLSIEKEDFVAILKAVEKGAICCGESFDDIIRMLKEFEKKCFYSPRSKQKRRSYPTLLRVVGNEQEN